MIYGRTYTNRLVAVSSLALCAALLSGVASAASLYYDAANDRIVFSDATESPGAYFTGSVGINVVSPSTALDVSGAWNMRGVAEPAASASGQGTIYFDSTANAFKYSANGSAYANLVVTSVTGSGTTSYIPKFTNTTVLGNSILYDNGTNVGIGTATPTSFKLQVAGNIGPNAAPTITTTTLTKTTVDTYASSGSWNSLAIGSDGLPVLVHSLNNVNVVHCGNLACTSGNTITTIGSGYPTALAIGSDGLPVIAGMGTSNLTVIKCGNAACSSGNTTTTGVDGGYASTWTSIAIGFDGYPVIASYAASAGADLRVIKCGNATCSSGNTSTAVDSTGDVGDLNSITIGTDGLPFISYRDTTNTNLKVVKCGNTACSSGNTITTADSSGLDAGNYTSVVIGNDGLPVVAHGGAGASGWGIAKVTKCSDVACTASTTTTVAGGSSPHVGSHISITVGSDGLPFVAYWNQGSYPTSSSVDVVKCGNASCTSGNKIAGVDSGTANAGFYTSTTIGTDGLPIIAYQDINSGKPKVAHCPNLYCTNDTGYYLSSGSDLGSRQYYFKNVYAAQYWGRQFQVADFADVAENYASDESLSPGTLVSVAPEVSVAADGTVTPKIIPALSGEGLLGVVSTNPAITLASEWGNTPIALAGRVPVRVSTENGPIRAGDPITASSTPGVGMRATQSGRIVGIALEAYAGEGEGKILVAVQPSFYHETEEGITERLVRQGLDLLGFTSGHSGELSATALRARVGVFKKIGN